MPVGGPASPDLGLSVQPSFVNQACSARDFAALSCDTWPPTSFACDVAGLFHGEHFR
jgi:hypothetical protein